MPNNQTSHRTEAKVDLVLKKRNEELNILSNAFNALDDDDDENVDLK